MKKVVNNKITYIIISVITIIVASLVVIISRIPNSNQTSAESDEMFGSKVIVKKVSTVSIYLSGPGIILDNSTATEDTYLVDTGSEVRLRAVNESRIFTKWNITGSYSYQTGYNETDQSVRILIIGDTEISVSRRDPVSSDFGTYQYNSFVIDDAECLYALQRVVNAGKPIENTDMSTIIKDYTHLLNVFDEYSGFKTDAERITFVKSNNIYDKIVNGYFLVANNLSLFGENFKGISNSKDNAFKGIFSGENNEGNSNVYATISTSQEQGTHYYGLFGYLDEQAVITNISLNISIAVTDNPDVTNSTIYAGGISGHNNYAMLHNVEVQTNIGIEAHDATIYAGGISGYLLGGINDFNQVSLQCTDHSWSINSKSDNDIYAGIIAGKALNGFIFGVDIDITGFSLIITNLQENTGSMSTNIYAGNLYGYLEVNRYVPLRNINIHGTKPETLRCILDSGQVYVSSFVGYLKLNKTTDNTPYLALGTVKISNSSNEESSFTARSLRKESRTNLYAGGLFAYIDQAEYTVKVFPTYNDYIEETIVDGKLNREYSYIFDGNFSITTIQNGICLNGNYGTSIAGGLVGYGYIDFNGTSDNDRINIMISSEKSKLKVEAIQSQLSTGTGTITTKNHCVAGLVYGLISSKTKINHINVYANNVTVRAAREIGSTALGDIYAGGFVGHTSDVDFENIKLYLNSSAISLDSLSYSGQTTDTNNNAYCGGFIGYFTKGTLKNIEINGFDTNLEQEVGTTLQLESIQNTIAGGADYKGENYLGGIVGQIYEVANVDKLQYIGSDTLTDKIVMQGHENPDSAFCGGIIGFVKNNSGNISSIQINDCFLKNASMTGYATVKDTVSIANPDIYLGGIIGASYCHDSGQNLTINRARVYDSTIETIGNEKIAVHAAGIIGAATWQSNRTYTVNDSYIYNTQITAISNSHSTNISNQGDSRKAFAAGICAHNRGITFNVNRSAVIDSIISATSSNNLAVTTGFVYINASGSTNTTGCYFNSLTNATGSTINKYPISNSGNATNTFYISKDSSTRGIKINTTDLAVNNNNENLNILNTITETTTNTFGQQTKFYPILGVNIAFNIDYDNDPATLSYIKESSDNSIYVDAVFLWINANENGDPNGKIPTDYETKEEAHNAGWFNIGAVKIYNKTGTYSDSQNITDIKTNYVTNNLSYSYDSDSNTYKNNNYPYNEVDSHFYTEKHPNTTVATNYKVVREYEIKLYKGMPKFDLEFKVLKDVPLLVMKTWVENDINTPVTMDNSKTGVGTFERSSTQNDTYKIYRMIYTPNIDLLNSGSNYTFYIGFNIGTSTNHEISCFKITLIPNKKTLVDVTYADYTKPLNYHEDNLGKSSDTAYLLAENSITKFLPVVTFSNDPNQTRHSEDTYADMANYSISAGSGHTIMTSGELTVGSRSDTAHTLTLTLVDDSTQSITIYYQVCDVYNVAVTSIGANANYIPYATTSNRFYLRIDLYSGYSSNASKFNVTIGTTTYNMNTIFSNENIFTVNAITADGKIEKVNGFTTDGYIAYDVYINIGKYSGTSTRDINADIEFSVTHAITFDLRIDSFYPEYTGPTTFTYNIKSGTEYRDYFKDLQTEINNFAKDATLYGYVFTGFYLVEDASSINAYGQSFEEITSDESELKVLTSNIFYARWSFLIELVEAPGTSIQSSFADSFMQEYYEENKLNRTIQIPINSNKGYVFTVLKEEGFIGEASVSAYTINKVGQDEIITNIEIEKYHDNMYLYFIPPEKINGYLVIVTSISNSQIIVGETTASVTDEVLPEDGIYTFKYIVNHKNNADDKSYIYDSGNANSNSNLEMNKDFLLRFKEQSYNNGATSLIERNLARGTIIEVYYQKIVNHIVSNNVIAAYKVNDETTSYVKLSDFTTVNQDQTNNVFEQELFKDFLGNNESVSEVYYFVITPPNGLSTLSEGIVLNYVVEAGYLDQNSNPLDEDPFVKGYRTKEDFAIKDIADELAFTKYESSIQQTMYSVTASRYTNLVKDQNKYIFTDDLTYEITTLETQKTVLENGVLQIFDDATNDSLVYNNKALLFDIHSLILTLGYNTGEVDIYGKKESTDEWIKVGTIEITSVAYQDYTIKFPEQYKYFKIDNISTKEIRCQNIQVVSNENVMKYDLNFAETNLVSTSGDINIYSFEKAIVGDARHNGKTFMLAVQLTDGTSIIENLPSDALTITYVIDGTTYTLTPSISNNNGLHTLFYNLSDILTTHNVETVTLEFSVKTGLNIHSVQLLEVANKFKPANGEVRITIN